jgi:hypothetical protein
VNHLLAKRVAGLPLRLVEPAMGIQVRYLEKNKFDVRPLTQLMCLLPNGYPRIHAPVVGVNQEHISMSCLIILGFLAISTAEPRIMRQDIDMCSWFTPTTGAWILG